nr:hypothetical protein [Rhodothermus marinus]
MQARFAEAEQAYARLSTPDEHPRPEARYLPPAELATHLHRYPALLFGTLAEAELTLSWDTHPQPAFHGNLNLLRERLHENARRGWETVILCDSRSQEARLHDLLQEEIEAGGVRLLVESLHEASRCPKPVWPSTRTTRSSAATTAPPPGGDVACWAASRSAPCRTSSPATTWCTSISASASSPACSASPSGASSRKSSACIMPTATCST